MNLNKYDNLGICLVQYEIHIRDIIKIEGKNHNLSLIKNYIDKFGLKRAFKIYLYKNCIIIGEYMYTIKKFIFADNLSMNSRIFITGKMLGYPICCIKEYNKRCIFYKMDNNTIDKKIINMNKNEKGGKFIVHHTCTKECLLSKEIHILCEKYYNEKKEI